jgi:serine/threonine protein kinase
MLSSAVTGLLLKRTGELSPLLSFSDCKDTTLCRQYCVVPAGEAMGPNTFTASFTCHCLLLKIRFPMLLWLQKRAEGQLMPLEWTKHVVMIMLMALLDMHAKGIVHRDPSLRNVLFSKDVSADTV